MQGECTVRKAPLSTDRVVAESNKATSRERKWQRRPHAPQVVLKKKAAQRVTVLFSHKVATNDFTPKKRKYWCFSRVKRPRSDTQ